MLRLGENWLDLDDYQVETLRRSALQIDAQPSHYLRSISSATTTDKPGTANRGSARGRSRRPRRDRWGFRLDNPFRQPLSSQRLSKIPCVRRNYGVKALKDYEEPEARDWRQDADDPVRIALNLSERLARFRESNAGKALQVVLFLIFIAIMCVTDGCR